MWGGISSTSPTTVVKGLLSKATTDNGYVQGDPSGWLKPPVDLVPTVLAVGGPLLQLPTDHAGWCNIPIPSQWEVLTILMGHPVALKKIA